MNLFDSKDINDLPTTIRGKCFYLYLFLEIVGSKIIGWHVDDGEISFLASAELRDLCHRESVLRHRRILLCDHGGPMKGATMLATLQGLDAMPSFSRPAVSNDNPYSESLLKILKFCPLAHETVRRIHSRKNSCIAW